MLPDFPTFKSEIQSLVVQGLVTQARQQSGLLAVLPAVIIFEGKGWRVTSEETVPFQEIASEMTLPDSELEEMSFQDSCHFLENGIQDVIRQVVGGATEKIKDAIREGHQGFGMSDDITEEGYLELFERLEVNFTPDGQLAPQLFASPAVMEKLSHFANSPTFHNRFEALLERKFVEYNDRENLRKLVG